MKTIRLLAVSLFMSAVCSVSIFAQTVTPAASSKIAVINSIAFGNEKIGITKYIGSIKTLNIEFRPAQVELETLNTKLQALAKEIEILRSQAASGKVPIDESAAEAKVDEAESLQRNIKLKQEDAAARFEKRQQALLGPVMQDIGKAITDFAKQKGYLLVFDIAKDEAGLLVAFDEKADVTNEFIAYYNAR